MKTFRILFALFNLISLLPAETWAQLPGGSDLARIGPREFVLDQARLLSPEQKQEIQSVCRKLLDDKNIPIIVVTIRSMREFPNRPQQIEGFARSVFDEWGIGFPSQEQNSWNRGMLMLVSPGDRQARIELGADWAREQDGECARIMQEQIIPYFRKGNYAGGILAGVRGLETLARLLKDPRPGEKLGAGQVRPSLKGVGGPVHSQPPPKDSSSGFKIFAGIISLMPILCRFVVSILSLFGYRSGEGDYRTGSGRYSTGKSRQRGYSGGASSRRSGGGRSSFGGGFSGRGGATGSW